MADAEFSIIAAGGKPSILLLPAGGGAATPLAAGANAALIDPGPDNVGFTYLGLGRLRWDGPVRRFLITGSVSGLGDLELIGRSHLAIMIQNAAIAQSGSNAIFVGDDLRNMTARVVRLLNTGDVVELAIIQPGFAAPLSIETAQLTIR